MPKYNGHSFENLITNPIKQIIILWNKCMNQSCRECNSLNYNSSHVTVAFKLIKVHFSKLICVIWHLQPSPSPISPQIDNFLWKWTTSRQLDTFKSLSVWTVFRFRPSAAHSQLFGDYNEGVSYKALERWWSVHVCFSSVSSSVCQTVSLDDVVNLRVESVSELLLAGVLTLQAQCTSSDKESDQNLLLIFHILFHEVKKEVFYDQQDGSKIQEKLQ